MYNIVKPTGNINPTSTYVLGLDLNRRGKDQTAFVILERLFGSEDIFISYLETQNYANLTEAIGRTLYLHSFFNFKKIYVDSTGIGSGVCDVLKEKISHNVVEEVIFTRNSKPEMFYNLKLLLQQNKLKIPQYPGSTSPIVKKLYFQFLSIQQEFSSESSTPRITHESGTHDDLICSLALAALYFQSHGHKRRGYFLSGRTN